MLSITEEEDEDFEVLDEIMGKGEEEARVCSFDGLCRFVSEKLESCNEEIFVAIYSLECEVFRNIGVHDSIGKPVRDILEAAGRLMRDYQLNSR